VGGDALHEVATILMRSEPGWIEHETSDATFVFQYKDAIMTIFPDGSWDCVMPRGLTQMTGRGIVNNLEMFLKEFAALNPL
jgi:hypothetical protein